jgi:phosphoribosylaminoimidazole-succinocarboxamide synthase
MELPEAILETDLEGLQLVSRGKVRDIYAMDDNLLIVTSDRISAYDSILPTGIPAKGMVLTALTEFWLSLMRADTYNHLITTDVDAMGDAAAPYRDLLDKRSMLVRRAEVLPVECVVRGYLAGSGWRSYKKDGTVCGIELPDGLQQADKLPEPIFTPTTKAEEGHDLPMTMDEVREEIGEDLGNQVRDKSIEIYTKAADYARERGIIICDTKFEWGLVDGNLTLVDEVLTPDSSRFWPADTYEPGKSQKSYDKQYVRDWLDESGWDHEPPAPELPENVVQKTAEKYLKACESLTGTTPLDED